MKARENVTDILRSATAKLAAVGIYTARLDAETLLAAALGLERLQLMMVLDRQLDGDELAAFEALLARRLSREPVSQILGHREFWSLDFKVTADTLTPRPDSETLVQAALDWVDGRPGKRSSPLRILDLGTGSGCLLLALLSELPHSWGLGIDRSEAALRVARENATRLGLAARADFMRGDWAAALADVRHSTPFDIVISNPPYITADEMAGLAPEVGRFEPQSALLGGVDGLDPYRRLAPELGRLMAANGAAFFEIGALQGQAAMAIFAAKGPYECHLYKDLGGLPRCVRVELSKKNRDLEK